MYVCIYFDDGMASLGRGFPRLKSATRVAVYSDGINGYVSGTKASFQDGGHRIWFDSGEGRFRLVYLPEACDLSMNISPAINPRYAKGTGQMFSCAADL